MGADGMDPSRRLSVVRDELRLNRCDLGECEGMCCYDGVYLSDVEEQQLVDVVASSQELATRLPEEFVVDGFWRGVHAGRKTAIVAHTYQNSAVPEHFSQTRCVFALSDARCSLEVLAVERGQHRWAYKPLACWMHPLRIKDGKPIPPPVSSADDPDRVNDDYPGYTTFTICGHHDETGLPWREALRPELVYWEDTRRK